MSFSTPRNFTKPIRKLENSECGQAMVEYVILIGFFSAIAAAFSSEVNWKDVWKTSDTQTEQLLTDHFPLIKRVKTP